MKSLKTLGAAFVVLCSALLVGCTTTRIAPLGAPTTEIISLETSTTLEYTLPTVDVYVCPSHGRIAQTVTIRGKEYCSHCLWEKLLDD